MSLKSESRKKSKVSLKIPGSTSNLGPGFDTLGMAVNIYLNLEAEPSDELKISIFGEGANEIKKNRNNLVYRSFQEYFKYVGEPYFPIKLTLKNEIPLKRGLGSSGAAIVGGLLIAREMTGKMVSDEELLNIATSIEGHPDNVTPTLFGGLTISCIMKNRVIFSRIRFPKSIKLAAVIPDINISTKEARAILPKKINFKDAVFNVQRVSLLINSFYFKDFNNIKFYFEDKLHQNYRKIFVPGFDRAVEMGIRAGALGVYLSGSGPTIMVFYRDKGNIITKTIADVFYKKNISCRIVYLKPVLEETFRSGAI